MLVRSKYVPKEDLLHIVHSRHFLNNKKALLQHITSNGFVTDNDFYFQLTESLRRPDIPISPRVPIELFPRMLPLGRVVKRFQPLLKLLVVPPAQILHLVLENARDITSSPVHDIAMGLGREKMRGMSKPS